MDENQVAYILSAVCFVLILLCYKINKKTATINLILFVIYSIYFYYGLFNWTEGTSLYAIVGLILFVPAHILILIAYLFRHLKERK